MITGWGAHHIDSAHWGMGTEFTGPVEVWGSAEFPDEGPVGRARAVQDRSALRRRREDDRQRRLPERHQVRSAPDGWIFVSRGNETVTASDPVAKLKDAQRAGRQRSEDHHVGHRAGRDPPAREHDHHGNWLECVKSRRAADRARRSRAPRLLRLPAPSHGHEAEAEAVLGSGQGALQERRRGQRDAVAAAATAVRDRVVSQWSELSP